MARASVGIHRAQLSAAVSPMKPRAWAWLVATSVVVVGAADAIVLDLVRGYFGTGYNGVALREPGEIAAFFAGGAALDLTAVALAWCAVLAAARTLRARPSRALGAAAVLGVALPLAFDLARHRLHRVLGDVLGLSLMLDLAAGSWRSALGEAAQDLPPATLLALGSAGAISVGFLALVRLERAIPAIARVEIPRLRTLGAIGCAAAVCGGGLLAWGDAWGGAAGYGWSEKPAGRALRALVSATTDVDRDGFGWLSIPGDPEPLDPAIHPYALEIPGNGVDEDAVGGDLPASFIAPAPVPVPKPMVRAGAPSVVLFFLESVRADVVGMRVDGREVTPFLNGLARRWTSATAYAHMPVTWAARASLMQGRVVPTPGGDTLVEDFLSRGYEVAWFSGQFDGIAETEARLGIERATHFYDARSDVERRTSRSAQPISLQVSWKTVQERVDAYLSARVPGAPLFLYVNLVDTHFPYWHRELDDILGVGEFPRSGIRPENRERLWRAYLNAAANVDHAIGLLAERAARSLGPDVVYVVTGDHGQSFYENGLLGHGQAIDDAQSAVPLVASRQLGPLPVPIALSDVRGVLGAWLSGEPLPTAALARREIFQHVGGMSAPMLVALRTRERLVTADPGEPGVGNDSVAAKRALWAWEALRLEAQKQKRRQP